MDRKNVIKSALPLAIILFMQVAIGALDTWFLKKQGNLDLLASFGLANGSYNSLGVIFAGTFSVAGVFYSQFRKDSMRMEATFLLFAAILAIIFMILLQVWAFIWEPGEIRHYLRFRAFGVFPYLMVGGMRYIFAGDIKTYKMIPVFILAIAFKYVSNTYFYPVVTLKTVALLSSATFWILFTGLFYQYRKDVLYKSYSFSEIKRFLLLGIPMGLMAIFDACGLFSFSVVAKTLGSVWMSAHQILIQGVFLTFAIPYSMNTIIAVMARDRGKAISSKFILLAGSIVSTVSLAAFYGWLYAVGHTLELPLLILGGAFQFLNGMQTVFVGAIRGVQDVGYPPKVAFVAYWLIGLPLSLYFSGSIGLYGVWAAMVIGQAIQFFSFYGRWLYLRKNFYREISPV